jgi:hypothetical protein
MRFGHSCGQQWPVAVWSEAARPWKIPTGGLCMLWLGRRVTLSSCKRKSIRIECRVSSFWITGPKFVSRKVMMSCCFLAPSTRESKQQVRTYHQMRQVTVKSYTFAQLHDRGHEETPDRLTHINSPFCS